MAIEILGDPSSGFAIETSVEGFTTTGADVFDPVPAEGHFHVWIGDEMVKMGFEPIITLPRLDPGTYNVMVSLSTNDHLDYVLGGEVISAETLPIVPGG